jgi:lysozyme
MTPNQMRQCQDDEGLILVVYDDANDHLVVPGYHMVGHPTIGYGRAIDVKGITQEEASYLFGNDMAQVEGIAACFPWITALDPVRRGVIEVMIFNMGLYNVLQFKTMIYCLTKQDWKGAAAAMLNSKWAEEVHARANRLAAQMLSGKDTEPTGSVTAS